MNNYDEYTDCCARFFNIITSTDSKASEVRMLIEAVLIDNCEYVNINEAMQRFSDAVFIKELERKKNKTQMELV